jgi:regulatory protein
LLARRDYFREELRQRLERKGYPPDEVEKVLARCDRLGLLDDRRLAARFAQLRATGRGWGPLRLEAELRRRGVDPAVAERGARLDPEVHEQALRIALRRAEVRAGHGWWRLPARRARMLSSLLNRGFDADDARSAVRDLASERESQQHASHDEQGDPHNVP